MKHCLVVAVALGCLLISGCTDTSIELNAYSQRCSSDDDCRSAFEGEVCNGLGCYDDNAAIAASDRIAYLEDRQQILDGCFFPAGRPNCSSNTDKPVACEDGKCTLR